MTIDKQKERKLELSELQNLITDFLERLYMPLRKSMLYRFIDETFEYDNTEKEVNFALVSLIEEGQIKEEKYYIASLSYAKAHRHIVPSATEEGIIRYISSKTLKETIKHDLFFNVYAKEHITPDLFFKYLDMEYPALIGEGRALHGLEFISGLMEYGLQNQLYVELNDYPTSFYLTSLFTDEDSRLIIKDIKVNRLYVNVDVILVPGKKGSYKLAKENYEKLCTYFPTYFSQNKRVCIHYKLLTMITGTKPPKKGR